jgi:osmotically-inducible protein OsmY
MTQWLPPVFRLHASICAMAICACLTALTGCATFGRCGLRACSADTKITAHVRTLLAQCPEFGGSNEISVQSFHGVVYLRGLVSTPYQIELAGSVAAQAPDVAAVRNSIELDNAR